MTETSTPPDSKLRRFGRRVRMVRAWRGLAMGACFGAAASATWALLDLVGVAYTEWAWMGALTVGGAALGAIIGLLLPLSVDSLNRSIDRRAQLEDRLTTAAERSGEAGPFDADLREDAGRRLQSLSPKSIYPIRVGRWHGGAAALAALAAAFFLLGNTPLLMSRDAKQHREDLRKQGEKVERIERENLETPDAKAEMSDAEKRLADELRRYQRELERARMTKEEAMQKANDIAKKADELVRQNAKDSEQNLDSAQRALEQMQKDELAKAGLQDVDPQMAQMSPEEIQQHESAAQQQLQQSQKARDALQSELDALNKRLKDPKLSSAERKALEEQKRQLEKAAAASKDSIDKARKELESMKLSKEAAEVLRKMMNNPVYKEIQQLAQMLRQNAKSAQDPDRTPISDEERKAAQKELEELMEKLKDEKEMKKYLDQLLQAMLHANAMGRCKKVGVGLGFGNLIPIPGTSAPGNSVMLNDIGKVNHSDKALPSQGSTTPSMITGSQRMTGEPAPYIEIKAPTMIGNRSAVPYVQVLPSYRRKAETALNRQEIPKDQEKRVKAYFDSLGH